MANIQHKDISDPNIHEPKGVAFAAAGSVYTADGSGGGSWELVAIGDAQIEGKHIKPFSELPTLTVNAADTVNVSNRHSITAGSITTAFSSYTTAYTIVVDDKITGSVRYKLSHKSSSEAYSVNLQVLKNGVVVGGPWSTSSTTNVERTADISVAPGDIITWQHNRGGSSAAMSTVFSPMETASDNYTLVNVYGKYSDLS